MAKKRINRAKDYKELVRSQDAVGKGDKAPSVPVDEDESSILSKTSRVQDEVDAASAPRSQPEQVVDLELVEMRIGLSSRTVLEYFLRLTRDEMREMRVSLKDKADVALRCVTVFEGSKQEISWQEKLRSKPKHVSLVAYKKERERKEKRLKGMLLRKKEVQVRQAEEALAEIERKREAGVPEEAN
jgi:hypothetical protein